MLLVGQPLPDSLAPGQTLEQTVLSELPAGLPSDLLAVRPDIRAAEQQLIGANANIGAARANFFPRISLTGSAGTASSELSGLFKSGSFGWTFAPQAVLPIFDYGRNSANLGSAKAGRDIAVAQYEKSIQVAFREVSDALAGQATFAEQLRAQRAVTAAEAERFNLSDLRYRSGAASYLDLLDAQRSLFVAQQATVQANLQRLQNQVTLYRVLGGGWTDPVPLNRMQAGLFSPACRGGLARLGQAALTFPQNNTSRSKSRPARSNKRIIVAPAVSFLYLPTGKNHMFSNLRISARLAIGFAIVLLLSIVSTSYSLINARNAAEATKRMTEQPLIKERLVSDWYVLHLFGHRAHRDDRPQHRRYAGDHVRQADRRQRHQGVRHCSSRSKPLLEQRRGKSDDEGDHRRARQIPGRQGRGDECEEGRRRRRRARAFSRTPSCRRRRPIRPS